MRFLRVGSLAGGVLIALVGLSSTAAHPAAADRAPRTLLWSDEFNGAYHARPDSQWEIQTGGAWGNNELESYTDRRSNVRLNGAGELQIVARHETYTGPDGIQRDYTSARLMGHHRFTYGYLVANMKLPQGQGLWPAFWTLGADIRHGADWPECGEIDIMEAINQMAYFSGTLHGLNTRTDRAYSVQYSTTPAPGWTSGWHQYGVYWRPGAITWYFDNQPFGTVRKADLPTQYQWEFDKPHVALLNLAIGGNWPGPPDDTTPFPAVMTVASVRLFDHP
jgi:beta-glucanase (GH16 family)